MMRIAACLALVAAPVFGATTQSPEPTIADLTTRDVLGYACVMEDDLDAAFVNAGKGGTVPQTCISETPVKDCTFLEPLLGHEATAGECMTHAYRYLTWFDADRSTGWGWDCGDCAVEVIPPPGPVPLPAAGPILLSGLGLLAVAKPRGTKKES